MIKLVYTGGGFGGSLHDIPARDLTDSEVEQHGGEAYLLATKLYERPPADKAEQKLARGGKQNKGRGE